MTFSSKKIVDYKTFIENQDADISALAWAWNMNREVYMTPGREEEWTLSVVHSFDDVDRYISSFEEMADELTR